MVKLEKKQAEPPVIIETPLDVYIVFLALPLRLSASAIIHCSWPFMLRNSSSAHLSRASIVSALTRNTKLFVLFSFAINGILKSPNKQTSATNY